MFALRSGQDREGRAGPLVLPRLLRRPARIAARAFDGEWSPPRFCATAMTSALVLGSLAYGTVAGGHVPAVLQAVTSRGGFAVEEIKIAGHKQTSEIDILDKIGLDGSTSLIGFDAEAARARVASLPWIEKATIRKVYPSTIDIKIEERTPFAIWQHGAELSLVEADGRVIESFSGGSFVNLPLVIGEGAAVRAADIVGKVAAYPELARRVKGFIRIADRRWDLRLENGVTIRLPEGREEAALARIAQFDKGQGLLSRDILAVDARIEDRLTVRLTPEALLRREASLKEAAKARAREKRI